MREMNIENSKLSEAVEHIEYEIQMLRFAHSQLIHVQGIADENIRKLLINSFLEVFAIHSRSLYYFLYTKIDNKPYPSDMTAEDFIEDTAAYYIERTPASELKIIAEKTGKQIAHLSYDRLKYTLDNKGWNFDELYHLLEISITAFLKSLNNERRSWFSIEEM